MLMLARCSMSMAMATNWRWYRADAGDVGGEAWTRDRQTNGIHFLELVCSSP